MFNIEEKMECIPDVRTKKLFAEVFSSYQHGNYRSAVVMLWSVVVVDIINKLQFLKNTYEDKQAINELSKIENKEPNDTSSTWESQLIEASCTIFKIISFHEKENLDHLHKQRHACAHPVLTGDYSLLVPSRDETRALIRAAMESVLLKPALLEYKLVDTLSEDLSSNKNRLADDENLKNYIKNKFITNISIGGAKKILVGLWKFVFRGTNEREIENRNINYRALLIFFEEFDKVYEEEIGNQSSNYRVAPDQIELLIDFLKEKPKVYPLLPKDLKTLVKSSIESAGLGLFFQCHFLSANIEDHYKSVLKKQHGGNRIEAGTMDLAKCYDVAHDQAADNLFFEICINEHSRSYGYSMANANYDFFIKPYLKKFSLKLLLEKLMPGIHKNNDLNSDKRYWGYENSHKNVLEHFYSMGGKDEQLQKWACWKKWSEKYREENDQNCDY